MCSIRSRLKNLLVPLHMFSVLPVSLRVKYWGIGATVSGQARLQVAPI